MLQELSNLVVADNTGAKRAMCFRILKQRKRYAHLGDVIRVAIKEASPTSTVKKGSVATAVIIRTGLHDLHDGVLVLKQAAVAVLFEHGIGRAFLPAELLGAQAHQRRGGNRRVLPDELGKLHFHRTEFLFAHDRIPLFFIWYTDSSLPFIDPRVKTIRSCESARMMVQYQKKRRERI